MMTVDDKDLATVRRLGALVEPLAAAVYFSADAQANYEALGLNYFEGYFCSRSASLGAAPWRVVCAAFAAFKPEVVERAVTGGWAKTTPAALLQARLDGARAQMAARITAPDDEVVRVADMLLEATAGLDVSGRVLFAGLAGLPVPGPDDPLGRLWRAADLVREHRGDGHIAAWVPHLDSVEVTTLTEPWWGIEQGSYVWTRGYGPDDVTAARERLAKRGLVEPDGSITDAGRELRERVEVATDEAARPVVERLGDRVDDLFAALGPWSKAMRGEGAYPASRASLFS
jgi:hypothetical protein